MESRHLASLTTHNDLLVRLIIRLSVFFEGLSSEVDAEMHTLRGHLAGRPDFTLAAVSANKLEKLLHHSDSSVKHYTKVSVSELEKALKQFQLQFRKNDSVNSQTAHLLAETHLPIKNLFELQTLCLKAIRLLSSVSEQQAPNAGPVMTTGTDAESRNGLFNTIQGELTQLIASYADKHPDDNRIRNLQQNLRCTLGQDALLSVCLTIIRMVVQDTLQEATLTGRVINRIHAVLSGLNDNVTETISTSKDNFARKLQEHEMIVEQLDGMGSLIQESRTLEKLKEDTQRYLDSMSASLEARKQADDVEQASLHSLLGAMQTQLISLQRQTQVYRRKLAEQMNFSHTDPLTHLPNRLAYNERFTQEYQEATKDNTPLSLAVVDIDYFKSINDRFGHAAGDRTLQVVGKHLKEQLQEDEFIARWGGEEFVLLFPCVDKVKLQQKLDTMRTTLEQVPFKFKQEKVSITASFGGTSLVPGDAPEALFERADKHLYQAKSQGRNSVVVN